MSDAQTTAIQKILGDQIKYEERRVTHYFGLNEAGHPIGAMIIGNEIGRSYPITFMVVINPDGTVKDVEVVEEECSEAVFQKPSIDAALRFKYKPRVIDGVAVEVQGVMNMFHYREEVPVN